MMTVPLFGRLIDSVPTGLYSRCGRCWSDDMLLRPV